jgi:hypothetical protein
MNRYLLASLLAGTAFAANVAYADNYGEGWDPQPTFHSARTRAEVIAEMQQARAEQQAFVGEDSGSGYLMAHMGDSTTTRQAARDEYIHSRAEVAAMGAEDSGSMLLARARRAPAATQLAGQAIAAQGD